jgi:chitin synthase
MQRVHIYRHENFAYQFKAVPLQVMYMYYLLGHRLMELPISLARKEVIARNTFILALDGDIDFKPEAVIMLLDLMKKDPKLGAACGRIHPTGNGNVESLIAIL